MHIDFQIWKHDKAKNVKSNLTKEHGQMALIKHPHFPNLHCNGQQQEAYMERKIIL
jgi:hypothetical protein